MVHSPLSSSFYLKDSEGNSLSEPRAAALSASIRKQYRPPVSLLPLPPAWAWLNRTSVLLSTGSRLIVLLDTRPFRSPVPSSESYCLLGKAADCLNVSWRSASFIEHKRLQLSEIVTDDRSLLFVASFNWHNVGFVLKYKIFPCTERSLQHFVGFEEACSFFMVFS
ncbi:Hypothetical protein NTJ_09653 [Nesidiocoris tenuis]|uniref:Uncharacterized protein n=1 Tax=Nesidiocoris tenuis TaxID=355587 RepID=A0ABN7AZT7_9HEMI|nr:Hypothetical protein NTJ_09653 [Nesidiocoris tenuis]